MVCASYGDRECEEVRVKRRAVARGLNGRTAGLRAAIL